MEVGLNKMEMTVSVCRFYYLFFFFIATSFHIITLTRYLWTIEILKELTDSGRNSVGSLKITHLLTVGGALSVFSFIF